MATGDRPVWIAAPHLCRTLVTPHEGTRDIPYEHQWVKKVKVWSARGKARDYTDPILLQCPDHDGLGGGDGPDQPRWRGVGSTPVEENAHGC